MIEVSQLSKCYHDHVAIHEVSFHIHPGEIVGLVGPNGAGKSTILRILTGFMRATSGLVKIAGLDIFEEPTAVKQKIGYLPEIPPVYLDMTVQDYLKFVARIKRVTGKIAHEVERVAQLAGIEHILPRLLANVSKGYRQRTGLAQALIGSPRVLILDEPTVGLDPIQIDQIRRLILDLARAGAYTILISSHILSEVRATCPRILMLARGRIVADAPIDALESQYTLPLEQVFARLAVG